MASAELPADFEEQQKAAANYQPEFAGPAVSELRDTNLIADNYAGADEAYQIKTKNLTQKYSQWRGIRPDGNCGWRAVLFLYFELLLMQQSLQKIASEEARVQGLGRLIESLGDQYFDLFSEEVDEIVKVFSTLKDLLNDHASSQLDRRQKLAAEFDGLAAPHAIYCFRLFVKAHMLANRDEFASFVFDMPLEDYCSQVIELPDREIEELGIKALTDILMAPAGYGLEVINLHDNPGSQVDVVSYASPSPSNFEGSFSSADPPVARLFFFPSHYDILYRRPEHLQTTNDIQVYTTYDLPEPSFDSSGMPVTFSEAQFSTHVDACMPPVAPNDLPAAQFDDALFEFGLLSSFVDTNPGFSQPDNNCRAYRAMVEERTPINPQKLPDACQQFQLASPSTEQAPERLSSGSNQQPPSSRPSLNPIEDLSLLVPFPLTERRRLIRLCPQQPRSLDAQESTDPGKECKDTAKKNGCVKFDIDGEEITFPEEKTVWKSHGIAYWHGPQFEFLRSSLEPKLKETIPREGSKTRTDRGSASSKSRSASPLEPRSAGVGKTKRETKAKQKFPRSLL